MPSHLIGGVDSSFAGKAKYISDEEWKRPDYAGFQKRERRIFWFRQRCEVRVNVPQYDRHDYHGLPIGPVLANCSSEVRGRGDKHSPMLFSLAIPDGFRKDRMRIMTETTNGFVLAEEDLKMRGSGGILETDSQDWDFKWLILSKIFRF